MASRFASLALVAATTVLPALGHTIYGPSFDWRTDAPLMDGWVQFNLCDAYWAPTTYGRWVPMNITGLNMTGNDYNPFDDLTDGQGGWRLTGDETSEIMFALADNYTSYFNSSITVGNQSGESGLYSHVVSTYLSSTESKSSTSRDVGTAGNLTTLPFTTQTVSLSKENTYSAHGCDQPWNFTITTVDADGTTQHHSGTDSLTVNVPTKQPATVTMANAYDPEFSAHLTYNGALPFLYSRGSSARIANISLEQSFSIGFCPDDD